MEQMESIRDQQESLAKLHFELATRQEVFTPLSEDGLRASNENMDLLMSRLEKLSLAIGKLNPGNNNSDGGATNGNASDQEGGEGLQLRTTTTTSSQEKTEEPER